VPSSVVVVATTADTPAIASFTLNHDGIGVSVNRLYRHQGARKFLTKEGKAFKDGLINATAQLLMPLSWNAIVDEVYCNAAWVNFELWVYADMVNTAWRVGGGVTKGGNRRSPMQKIDVSNYLKLIEDSIAEATGIDDSMNMDVTIHKRQSVEPRIVVKYEVYEAWVEPQS